jgi:hypothetical protein
MAKKKTAQPVPSNETNQPIVRGNVNRHITVSPSFVSLYANDTQLQTTPWDVRLIFGEIDVERSGKGIGVVVNVTQVGEVRMSPQHAKRVVMLLAKQLQAYEQSFGPIPQPKD